MSWIARLFKSAPKTVSVRDLRPGDRIMVDETIAVISGVEWLNEFAYYGKTARAAKISFLNHEPIKVHPGQPAKLA